MLMKEVERKRFLMCLSRKLQVAGKGTVNGSTTDEKHQVAGI